MWDADSERQYAAEFHAARRTTDLCFGLFSVVTTLTLMWKELPFSTVKLPDNFNSTTLAHVAVRLLPGTLALLLPREAYARSRPGVVRLTRVLRVVLYFCTVRYLIAESSGGSLASMAKEALMASFVLPLGLQVRLRL